MNKDAKNRFFSLVSVYLEWQDMSLNQPISELLRGLHRDDDTQNGQDATVPSKWKALKEQNMGFMASQE